MYDKYYTEDLVFEIIKQFVIFKEISGSKSFFKFFFIFIPGNYIIITFLN